MCAKSSDSESRDARRGRLLNALFDGRRPGSADPELASPSLTPTDAAELRQCADLIDRFRRRPVTIALLIAQKRLRPARSPGFYAELGPYRIVELIGAGGMGIVFKAHEPRLDRLVALKILRPELAEKERARSRFIAEARAAAGLRHPNIVTIYAVDEDCGSPFIAMEYVPGGTLADRIREHGPLPAETARRIMAELLAGLQEAHAAGLIHRDIKPANLLLDGPEQRVRIADFGLARVRSALDGGGASSGTSTGLIGGTIAGTPDYMSPEQARGETDIDQRTDLYSAGVVLYEMLAGNTPLAPGSSTEASGELALSGLPRPLMITVDADPALASLTKRLLAPERDLRFDSAAAASRALAAQAGPEDFGATGNRRLALTAFLVVVVGTATAWLTGNFSQNAQSSPFETVTTPQTQKIVDARVRESSRRQIEVQYEDGGWWPVDWLSLSVDNHFKSARFINAVGQDGSESPVIVAGLNHAHEGANLFGFDTDGAPILRMLLNSDESWPDGGPPPSWSCRPAAIGDVLEAPGDEMVVIASGNGGYACELAIIDPYRGEKLSSFWHIGTLHDVRIEPGYFEEGGAAIIAWGLNNKLDGFNDEKLAARLQAPTQWDYVPIITILDPTNIDGVGPPASPRFDFLEPATPHAYAFLDMASSMGITELTSAGERPPKIWEVAWIEGIRAPVLRQSPGFQPWKEITIVGWRNAVEGDPVFRAALTVDRNLKLIHVEPAMPEDGKCATREFWEQRWIVLCQNGVPIREGY